MQFNSSLTGYLKMRHEHHAENDYVHISCIYDCFYQFMQMVMQPFGFLDCGCKKELAESVGVK